MLFKSLLHTYPHNLTEFYKNSEHLIESSPAQAVAWFDKQTQEVRFFILSQINPDLSDAAILDVGAGLGDLYPYLKERYADFKYTALEYHGAFVKELKARYPEISVIDNHFLNAPLVENSYDYVFCSGALTVKNEDTKGIALKCIEKMFKICKKGVAFNMLSDLSDQKIDEHALQYFSPTEIFLFAKSLTPFVTLRHDYLKGDFTIYLYK
jgi:SAM-dependent methyltransferase